MTSQRLTEELIIEKIGPRIAQGRTAEIFDWNEGQILKLLFAGRPDGEADYEYKISQTVQDTGLDVPRVIARVQVEGRPGIIYERIAGPAMLQELVARPWRVWWLARVLAQLHFKVHRVDAPTLMPRNQVTGQWIQNAPVPDHVRAEALRRLDELPAADKLCHGDFHPGNIILGKRGPVVIDWMNAYRGNPVGDVAWTSMLLRIAVLPPLGPFVSFLIQILRRMFHSLYLQEYERLRPGTRAQLGLWLLPVIVLRLGERIPEERGTLLRLLQTSM